MDAAPPGRRSAHSAPRRPAAARLPAAVRLAAGAALLLALAAPGSWAAAPKGVLILNSTSRNVTPHGTVVSVFRSTLARELGQAVHFEEVSLDLLRYDLPGTDQPFEAFLRARLANAAPDLVVPVGAPAARFALRHREDLFSGAPLLYTAVEPRLLPPEALDDNAALVTFRANLTSLVEEILQLRPETANIAVVLGATPIEEFWTAQCRREFGAFAGRVGFTWLTGLSLDQLAERAASLPPASAILVVVLIQDAAGVPFEKDEALVRLRAEANAPVFGYFASQLGLGPVGGRLLPDSAVAAASARVGVRILRGERPGNIPREIIESDVPEYDWRELRRWGIDEARLPAGSVVRFREPSLWDRYRGWIVAAAVVSVLQTGLVVGLVANRAQRRRTERAAELIAGLSSRFVDLAPGDVDREIGDAQRQVCEYLGLDLSVLWQWSADPARRLALTHFFRREGGALPTASDNAEEAFPWTLAQLQAGRIVTVSSLGALPPEASRDREAWLRLGSKASVTIPLSAGGEPPVGALSFHTMVRERAWPEEIVQRLKVVAEIFTSALARKRADLELRDREASLRTLSGRLIRAHEEQRTLLARELHDDLTQRIARLAIDAGRLEQGAADAATAEQMRSVRDGLMRLSEDVHALSYRLHPTVLEDLGLAAALESECDRVSRQGSLRAALNLAGLPASIPREAALCLFRVAQEALRNAVRHANARTAEVSLRALDGGLQLAVHDDGVGFEPARERGRPSLGLASMRERAELLRGEFDIESAPGQGTTVVAWVPLEDGSP